MPKSNGKFNLSQIRTEIQQVIINGIAELVTEEATGVLCVTIRITRVGTPPNPRREGLVVEIERGMHAGDDGLQGGVMPGVGHAVDEEHGFVEFLRAIVLGAENEAEHGVAVDGFVIFSAGGSRGEIRVTAFPEKLPVGAQ